MGFLRKAAIVGTLGVGRAAINPNSKKARSANANEKMLKLQRTEAKKQNAERRRAAPNPAVSASRANSTPPPVVPVRAVVSVTAGAPDLDDAAVADQLEKYAAEADGKARMWEAKANTPVGKFNSAKKVEHARGMVETFRAAAKKNRQRAESLRAAAPLPDSPTTEAVNGDAASVGSDLAHQLVQLAELKASGALNDEEFAAAKARLLG